MFSSHRFIRRGVGDNHTGQPNVLTRADMQMIRNQAEISKSAMLKAMNEPSFQESTKDKLLKALIEDFKLSVERHLENAVRRKGDKAFLAYKLNKADNKIRSELAEASLNDTFQNQVFTSMIITKAYILKSLPSQSGLFAPKIDFNKIVEDYISTLTTYIQNNSLDQSIKLMR